MKNDGLKSLGNPASIKEKREWRGISDGKLVSGSRILQLLNPFSRG